MPDVRYDRYYRYDDLTRILRAYVDEYPGLVALDSIGKSHEGRDIWLVTVTDGGDHREKPAFWCDGNIHASEVSASTTVLMILDKLVGKKQAPTAAALLKDRTFYLVPRFNPDGAEWALEDTPRIVRSSTRPYPYDEDDLYGLERRDMDGDGRILSMRVKDPNGPWKVAEDEPRLLKRREPGEVGGEYYRLLPEGVLHNYDGLSIRSRKVKEGLDMNRNFPSAWRLEGEQYGAGPYPTSEPEVRAIVQAISDRPNICGAMSFHTFSGVLLRPPSRMPDDDIPAEDLWTYQELGANGHKMTGYPAISNYHEFKYHPKEVITGVFDDWMYEHRGVHAWTVEIWSPQRQAGITDYKYIDWFRTHPFEDDVKLLKWSDEALGGHGYEDWRPYVHPQLGDVEIGGWDPHYAFRNPPPDFLENEVGPLADWALWHSSTGPCLALRDVRTEKLDGGAVRIRFAVQNSGWLPTNVTKMALDKKLCRGVVGEIVRRGEDWATEGTEPSWLVSGRLREDKGQLVGWSHVPIGGFGWHSDPTEDIAVFEWVVSGPGTYDLTARHERAGAVKATVEV
ncbi:MAG: carboxypeptidase [Armatimonadetes bacterium]|nr:carboxypeptidase [Armatimonadota bacterium]